MKSNAHETHDLKVSFQSKEEIMCPVCDTVFHREEMLSGSGRLIAGALTDELHRLYEPSVKYGELFPLAYQATVCPCCWYASTEKDFLQFPHNMRDTAFDTQYQRINDTGLIFPGIDFHEPRELFSGAASQYLTLRCYEYFPKEFSPTIKQAIAALRTGWLLDHINERRPGEHYDWLAVLFKRKAFFLYNEAINRELEGKEKLSGLNNFGPDTDKNYAYEGALYLGALLRLKYGPRKNTELRISQLGEAKRTIAKIFGIGKSSKSKPGPLLEYARSLYEQLNKELNETDE
ncbi:MAG: DUF2225 domain-containing protein [Treponema sp.]|jgi:uncharacterized protein (DUF2225 family)|nr:DUF2225 domain-containing protein [Treponema sp.]